MGFNHPFEPWERRRSARRRGGSWLIGLILIVVGALFLASNAGIPIGDNWWALFLMIPALGCAAAAWNQFERGGYTYTPAMTGPISGFLVLTFIALMLFFSLSFSLFWPVFIIIAGFAALLGRIGQH